MSSDYDKRRWVQQQRRGGSSRDSFTDHITGDSIDEIMGYPTDRSTSGRSTRQTTSSYDRRSTSGRSATPSRGQAPSGRISSPSRGQAPAGRTSSPSRGQAPSRRNSSPSRSQAPAGRSTAGGQQPRRPSSQPAARRRKKKKRLNRKGKIVVISLLLIMIALCIGLVVGVRAAFMGVSRSIKGYQERKAVEASIAESKAIAESEKAVEESLRAIEESIAAEEAAKIMPYEPDDIASFHPTHTENTDPSKLISTTHVMVNGTQLSSVSDYKPKQTITFDSGSKYTNVEGVVTFRGNNFRSNPTYGVANMTEFKMEKIWSQSTGATSYNGKTWNGSGWTGQPLVRTWTKEERSHMNMEEWAKQQEELTEVIYATLDGHIYFLELETGKQTRPPMEIGYTFKGAGALDPRGYPIMYVGSGYTSNRGTSRVFVINLLDCSVMYTFGNDDGFAMRGCYFFDSSALVDAETDTLIYPGESGVLYLIHLNTKYDKNAGTLSIDPDDIVKWNYYGTRTSKASYWLGMEDSAVIYEGYLFIADNGGNFMCLDLNTLQLVWVQNTLDDTNCTPVLSVEDGHPYLYISTSFHLGWRSSGTATIPIWKIDAENGEIIWQVDYQCESVEDVSGGVQSTLALGQKTLSDYIYVTVSRTGGISNGVLTCINKKTGQVEWEHKSYYAWSSPVCVYHQNGTGRVLYANCAGKFFMLDGINGEESDVIELSDGAIEASPVVFNDMVVIGTRAGKIWGIKLK